MSRIIIGSFSFYMSLLYKRHIIVRVSRLFLSSFSITDEYPPVKDKIVGDDHIGNREQKMRKVSSSYVMRRKLSSNSLCLTVLTLDIKFRKEILIVQLSWTMDYRQFRKLYKRI